MADVEYLIVGAGLAGSVCAEQLAQAGKRVLVVEKRAHVAGNAYDYYNIDGILVHAYGPHIFHTNSQAVYDYLSRFTAWRPYVHRVKAFVSGSLLPMPINRTTLAAFQGDLRAAMDALVRPYTRKQWGCDLEELDPSVLARIQPRDSADDRYFTDAYQVMPVEGYTRMVQRMLDHPLIKVLLNTTYREAAALVSAARVIYTGPIDEYFDHVFGPLPYRSARFAFDTLATSQFQSVGVVNYPTPDAAYTRITEFKHLTGQVHAKTTIAREYPQADGEPYWPMPTPASLALAKRYKARAADEQGVWFCGRLGTYQYLNMDQAVAQALTLARRLVTGVQHADTTAA